MFDDKEAQVQHDEQSADAIRLLRQFLEKREQIIRRVDETDECVRDRRENDEGERVVQLLGRFTDDAEFALVTPNVETGERTLLLQLHRQCCERSCDDPAQVDEQDTGRERVGVRQRR